MPRTSTAQDIEPLLDIAQAAESLGTSVRHMRRLVQERELPVVKIGGKLRFEPADLVAYRRAHRTPAG